MRFELYAPYSFSGRRLNPHGREPQVGITSHEPTGAEILTAAPRPEQEPTTLSDALARWRWPKEHTSAIGAGEIDAFLVSNRRKIPTTGLHSVDG